MNATAGILDSLPRWQWSRGWLRPRLLLGGSVLGLLLLSMHLWPIEAVPLARLRIDGTFRHVQPEQVRRAAGALLVTDFFHADLGAIRDAVAQIPWVARVRVERSWPGGIRIRVWEREALARWGDAALIDAGGVVFRPDAASMVAELPRLAGPVGYEQDVIDSYRLLSTALAQTPLALAGLQLDERGEWRAQTVTGIELRLGQEDPAERLPSIAGTVIQTLNERLAEVRYVDFRYSNGFAVGWRESGAERRAPARVSRHG